MIGAQFPEACTEVEINILRSSVHLFGFIKKTASYSYASLMITPITIQSQNVTEKTEGIKRQRHA